MRLQSVTAAAAFVLLAACGQGQPKPPADKPVASKRAEAGVFRYTLGEDAAGDYAPLETVQIGEWKLEHISISGPHSFESWIGGERSLAHAPVMMVFNGKGDPGLAVSVTAVPSHFDISENHVRFSGSLPHVGDYRFDGRIDLDALATARRTLGAETEVLKGTLKVGSQSFNNLGLKIKTGG